MKFFALLLALWTLQGLAQVSSPYQVFVENKQLNKNAFALPITVNVQGDINFLKSNGSSTNASALVHFGYSSSEAFYINPIVADALAFLPQEKDLNWIEVKKRRYRYGLGLQTNFASVGISLGLIPYKGAKQAVIRMKTYKEEETPDLVLPNELEQLQNWSIGDEGTFQRFGGVQISAGIGVSLIDIAQGTLQIQNVWTVGVKKVSESKILLSLNEEKSNRREITIGPFFSNSNLSFVKGNTFSSKFILDLRLPLHHDLYKKALAGHLDELQSTLSLDEQEISWRGNERSFYFGIPKVIGKIFDKSHYDLGDEVLDVKARRSSGFIVPVRNHLKIIYQTKDALVLFLSSEMNNAHKKVVQKHYLSVGRMMGIKGFDSVLPRIKLGSTLTQLGLSFNAQELKDMMELNLEVLKQNLGSHCAKLELSCAKKNRLEHLMKQFKRITKMSNEKRKSQLGLLLFREPALIKAIVKSLKKKKQVYFRFLSEKFQSLEGMAAIEI